jgi:hypothetical protein
MSIYDRLSKISPRSLPLLNRSVHKVTGEYFFSGDELVSMQESKSSARRARIKTKLTLKYPDASVLNRVYFRILKARIQTGALYFSIIIALSIGIAYLVFTQLPRAYTIGYEITLNEIEGNTTKPITLHLYTPKVNSGTSDQVESMLYKGTVGSAVQLEKDDFISWILARSSRYFTDTANIITDKSEQQTYQAFFSEFMSLTDTIQSASVRLLDIQARRIIFEYMSSSEFAGATLATNSVMIGSARRCPSKSEQIHPRCFMPFMVDSSTGVIRYFHALRKDGKLTNLVLEKNGDVFKPLEFTFLEPSVGGASLSEQRELFWLSQSSDCACFYRSPQYFVGGDLYAVYGSPSDSVHLYSVKQ